MIGYNCKYAPVEIMAGFGEKYQLINNVAENFDYSSAILHLNMCSHAKAVLENVHRGGYRKLLFMNCCDSSRRVFDAVSRDMDSGVDFSCCLDLPSCTSCCAVEKFRDDLLDFINRYEKFSGITFDVKHFLSSFSCSKKEIKGKYVALLGARSNKTIAETVRKCFKGIDVLDLTCANNRDLPPFEAASDEPLDSIMLKYSKALLSQVPCMRMQDIKGREALIESKNCLGIIYCTVKFCDYYDFEFSQLENKGIPVIKVETDFTSQSSGQLTTRLEGFYETVRQKSGEALLKDTGPTKGKFFLGIDSGSTSTELVALDRDLNIVKMVKVPTGSKAAVGAKKALEQSGIDDGDIAFTTATGYGRKNIDFADYNVTEITCHARGAKYLYDDVTAVIDIGGQDSKVISLDENGLVSGFAMNDKCAAGTGRFLENMAKILELDMESMSEIGLNYKKDLNISSMCTVFAESEVVSLIAENNSVKDIVHGLNKSVALKTKALSAGVKDLSALMMTGGVANNKGVVSELEKQLNTKIFIPEHPEFCGALGAALIAAEQFNLKKFLR